MTPITDRPGVPCAALKMYLALFQNSLDVLLFELASCTAWSFNLRLDGKTSILGLVSRLSRLALRGESNSGRTQRSSLARGTFYPDFALNQMLSIRHELVDYASLAD